MSRKAASIYAVMFAALVIPALGTVVDIAAGPDTSRLESVAKTPALGAAKSVLADARHYLKKRYAFKDSFVRANGVIKTGVFGVSPYASVLMGEDGFLFLADNETRDFTQAVDLFDPPEAAQWAATMSRVAAVAENAGADFAFSLAPGKETIYGELMPSFARTPDGAMTRADQLIEILKRAEIPAIDLRKALMSAKASSNKRLYHRTDTHWNGYGGSIAAAAVAAHFGRDARPGDPSERQSERGGDLARMIGLQDRAGEVLVGSVAPSAHCLVAGGEPYPGEELDPLRHAMIHCDQAPQGRGRAIIFIDSFGVGMIPTLASAFDETRFVWSYQFDTELVSSFKPDVVIVEIAERKLQTLSPDEVLPRNEGCVENQRGPRPGAIVLFGNSLIHDHVWRFGDRPVINCGRQGMVLAEFLRAPLPDVNSSASVVLSFGTVEALRGAVDRAAFRADLERARSRVAAAYPGAGVIIVAPPPITGATADGPIIAAMEAVRAASRMSPDVFDAANAVTGEAALNGDPTYDGVHLTRSAYRRWNAALNARIEGASAD